ncbi:MAG: RNA polymerase sigma factor [Verrucomicrobiales bacterium]
METTIEFGQDLPAPASRSLPAPAVATPAPPREGAVPHPHPREAELVGAARGGDPGAYRQIVEFYQGAVFAFCYRWLRSPEDAREACQDTFIRAHAALPKYKHGGKLTTWLYQIALNLCRDRARSPRLSQPPGLPLEACPDLACGSRPPDAAAAWNGDLGRLERGLGDLPRRLREAIILCGIEGLSHEEAAAVMKCSPRAVEGRLYRARQRLLRWWQAEG